VQDSKEPVLLKNKTIQENAGQTKQHKLIPRNHELMLEQNITGQHRTKKKQVSIGSRERIIERNITEHHIKENSKTEVSRDQQKYYCRNKRRKTIQNKTVQLESIQNNTVQQKSIQKNTGYYPCQQREWIPRIWRVGV
jgi:hypothetical protein